MQRGAFLSFLSAVDQGVGGSAQRRPGQHIPYGMLLEEQRRDTDGNCRQRTGNLPAPALKTAAVPQAEVRRERPHHVERRTDIRVGVKDVEPGGKPGQCVVPGKNRGPQVLAVGEEEVDQHRHPVGEEDEGHHPPEGRDLPEVGVCHRPAQVEEPKEVGHHGSLPEGDAVVQGAVHHKVLGILRPQPLQGHESQLKDRPEEQEPGLRRQELSPEPGPEAQGRIRRFKGLHGATSLESDFRHRPVL